MKISACLVIRNEEEVLKRCLESLKSLVDEIIVVHDGPCTDKSLDIAKSFKAKIFIQPYIGEAEYHRPFSFKKATSDWILLIDADEYLDKADHLRIKKLIEEKNCQAFSFAWPYPGKEGFIKKGPFSKTYKPVLFKKSQMYMLGISHDYPRTYGRLCRLSDLVLYHKQKTYNWTSFSFTHKWSNWAKIQARQMANFRQMPVFNINDEENNPRFHYYQTVIKHPLLTGCRECVKFCLIYLSRGIILAGPVSWKIACYEILYLWLVRFYVVKFKFQPAKLKNS